jgi:2-amino-4-hydroxy-6-hydroxymethyldihydropteridine diphosphokinase
MADAAGLAFLSLGSNIAPLQHLPAAVHALRRLGTIVGVSPAVESAAWGPGAQPRFVNAAVLLQTMLSPADLHAQLRLLEAALGRVRTSDKFAPRGIDLDLCLYGSSVMEGPPVRLPDPAILERAYLCHTLAALAPDFPHPLTGESLQVIALRLAAGADLRPRPEVTAALRRAASRESEGQAPGVTDAEDHS